MNTIKYNQLNRSIQRIISEILHELENERWSTVTVANATINPSGTQVVIWIYATPKQLETIESHRKEIQYRFMRQYSRRKIPTLIFKLRTEEMDRLEKTLEEIGNEEQN